MPSVFPTDAPELKPCMAKPSYTLSTKVSTSSPDIFHDFDWTETDEPHASRRKVILAQHPEIKELFSPDVRTAYAMLVVSLIQLYAAHWAATSATWWQFLLVAYSVGGTLNHMLHLLNHDVSHNLAFRTPWHNRVLGIVGCFVTALPSAETFRKFHMEHHRVQGVDGIDMDIPSEWEVNFFQNVWYKKVVWCMLQPLMYGLRPLYFGHNGFQFWERMCWLGQVAFDVLVYKYMGAKAVGYMLCSSYLGMTIHPSGGHFISEHYVFLRGWETYSTYSWWNWFIVNVGYHNEHHDFPKVPWTRLPEVRRLAPEHYDNIPFHTSFAKVFYNFIFDDTIGCYSRLKRPDREHNKKL